VSPLPDNDSKACPIKLTARVGLPSKKAMLPSSPLARAAHCCSPNVVAMLKASAQERLAEAVLTSTSTYPANARHQRRSFKSDWTIGSRS
jgi:hypothetical protein